jgi:hypothetical protein
MNIKRNITSIFKKRIEKKTPLPLGFVITNLITTTGTYSGGKLKIG